MKLFYALIIFFSVNLANQHVYAETYNINLTEKDFILRDCEEQNNLMCYYEEAARVFENFWYLSTNEISEEKYYEIAIQVSDYLAIFIREYEKNNELSERIIYADALQKLTRIEWLQASNLTDLKDVFKNIEILISIGETYNTWRYCTYSMEFYYGYLSTLDDEDKEFLTQAMINSCDRFINEDSLFPAYDASHVLADTWDSESKEQIMFDVYLSLYYINRDINNDSLKAIQYAKKAEEQFNSRRYEWIQTYEDLLGDVYGSIGLSYINGYGVPTNPVEGIKFLEKASALEDVTATTFLGEIYEKGKFELFDLSKAREYYLKAIQYDPLEYTTYVELGEIYLYGFGVEKDIAKAKYYFENAQSAVDTILNDSEIRDNWMDFAEPFQEIISLYLSGFKNNEYIPVANYVCEEAQDAYLNARNSHHLIRACREEAENNLYAALRLTDFYRQGAGVPKDLNNFFLLSKDLIAKLEQDTYENTAFSDYFENEDDYNQNIQDSIIYLNGQIALSVFNGSLKDVNPAEAHGILKSYLFNEDKPINTEDPWYIQDWYMYISMKIDGWGTTRDIEEAEKLVELLSINYEKSVSSEDISEEDKTSFQTGIELINVAKDKLVQSKAGFSQRSNILIKFPATYKGQMTWSGAEEVLSGTTSDVTLKIDKVRRSGFKNYTLDGTISFTSVHGTENFYVSGIIDDENKLFTLEEYDSGSTDFNNYTEGKYFGKFTDNYKNIEAQFVTKSSTDFANLQLFKETDDNSKTDYKKLLGIKKQYAVVIGNNEYQNLGQLDTATADARSLADVLEKKYGFEVEEPLINATRNEILMKLSHMTKMLNEDDSLLIYYAGHGRQDIETGRGYWSPVDALEDEYINDISNDDITNLLKKLNSRHILIIADSCYSGSLVLRGSSVDNKKNISYLKTLVNKSSRKALTSGALQPVSDTGSNGHSAFASSLLTALTKNENPMTANELHQIVRPSIMSDYNQTPLYNVVGNSGDEGGEFIFIPIQ